EKNLAVDATCGKKTKTVIIMDSGHIILSAKSPDRLEKTSAEDNYGENDNDNDDITELLKI
ncbi:MAG: DUF370 domain-containing protein, partial [Ruminiclostridium sp.]|nr:DUF370 domain-containing protein [Ruminiclostridium sp.]